MDMAFPWIGEAEVLSWGLPGRPAGTLPVALRSKRQTGGCCFHFSRHWRLLWSRLPGVLAQATPSTLTGALLLFWPAEAVPGWVGLLSRTRRIPNSRCEYEGAILWIAPAPGASPARLCTVADISEHGPTVSPG